MGKANSRRRHADRCLTSVCLGLMIIVGGCATDKEALRQSQGYYQEGVASLPGDRQKAFVSFQKSVQLNPANKEARYALGHVYALQGKLTHAEAQFREAIKIDESYAEAHTYLGQVLANQNRWDDAVASYKLALGNPLYPTPDLARFHLGRALAQQGDLHGSMEAFEDAASTSPPSVPPALTHLELGRVYYKLGYTTRAREVLKKVVTMDEGGDLATAASDLLTRLK